MLPLALLQFANFKNILIVICIALSAALFFCNISKKVQISKLNMEIAQREVHEASLKVSIANLEANYSLQKTAIELLKMNEVVYKNNITSLQDQLKKNDQVCNNTINNLRKSCDIYKTSYNECIDPKQVPSVDKQSSKLYIELLNKK